MRLSTPCGTIDGVDQGGMPAVFLHGLRTSRTMWRAQVAAVEASGHRAVAVDLPGHGERLGEPFTLDGAVEAVRRAVDGVGGRAVVVGLSLGGYVGIAHAARYPQQVAGLVAASCCTRPYRPVVRVWEVVSRVIVALPDGGAGLNRLAVRLTLPRAGAQDAGAGGFALDVMTDALRALAGRDVLGDLRRVEAPVWLVNGRFDHFRGEERAFLAACRDGRLVVVPGATHLVSLVRPTRFSRAVLDVLAVVDGGKAGAAAAAATDGRGSPVGREPSAGASSGSRPVAR